MTKTIKTEWGNFPSIIEMAKLAGIDIDQPLTLYTEQGVGGGEDKDLVDYPCYEKGLVSYGCEESDELWLDGKLIWYSASARFYSSVLLRHADGRIVHHAMSNDSKHLGLYNDDVGNNCKVCFGDYGGRHALTRNFSDWKFCKRRDYVIND